MSEKPILFSGPMVRAILAGTKTQTRRIMKPQPHNDFRPIGVGFYHPTKINKRTGEEYPGEEVFGTYDEDCGFVSRYAPGDTLWVREAWCHKINEGVLAYNAEGNLDSTCCHYAADGYEVLKADGDGFTKFRKDGSAASPWAPSIHMPRWASRITLLVKSVRVERLKEISEADAMAEGVDPYIGGEGVVPRPKYADTYAYRPDYRTGFSMLWNSIHGFKGEPNSTIGHGWEDNPWVWRIEFERIKP